jgi:hypothetical protein
MLRILTAVFLMVCSSAYAQSASEALAQCLAENTSGRDRKDLARWVFFAMASHPEIRQYAAPSLTTDELKTHKAMADLVTRLLAESCLEQTQQAIVSGGSKTVEVAFRTLGELAMRELMSNPAVGESMSRFEKQIDQSRLGKAFGGR